uniref:CC domain-containing protein n=2 Tax=Acrobeloides nanus TaxID=290746 RepID=A0A914C4V8_9BILA
MFYVLIFCLIQVIVAEKNDISIIRAKRQNNFCANGGGVYLYKSCSTSTDCNNIASVPTVCNNGYCCTAGPVNPVNQTTCPSGYQSLGISCQAVSTCTQATTSPVICQNGLCCLTSSTNGNGNGNSNNGTCPIGSQSIGIPCQSVATCQTATTSPVTCQNGLCCLTSPPTNGNGIGNSNNGTCPIGSQSIGIPCQSVATCQTATTSPVTCQNGLCCLTSPTTNGNGNGNSNNGTCPIGSQSIGIPCQSVATCQTATTSPVTCQNGLCCLTSSMLNGNGNSNNGTCPIGSQSIGIPCQSVTTCQQATTSPVTCQNGLCCMTSGVLPASTPNTGVCPIGYQTLGIACQNVLTCQTSVGSSSSNSVTCQNGECCLPLTSNNGTAPIGNVG